MKPAMCQPVPEVPDLEPRPKALRMVPQRRWWGSTMPDLLPPDLEQLLEDACEAFTVPMTDVRLPSTLPGARSASVTKARHVFWWVARDWLGHSFPELGRMLGRDHTSVMSGCKRVVREIARGSHVGQVALRLRAARGVAGGT